MKTMVSYLFVLSGVVITGFGSYISIPVKRIVSPPVRTGLTARRMEKYALLPAEDWRPNYDLDYLEYFAAVLQIGSPSQRQSVIIDTGSSITFVACTGCPPSTCNKHEDPNFLPAISETFEWEDCSTCRHGKKFTCHGNGECNFNLRYYDKAGASGRIFSDLVDFGWDPLRLQMGCAEEERGGVITDHADGMMGLAIDQQASLTFQIGEQLRDTQVAHCFKSDGRGTLIFGEWEKPKDITWTVLNTGSNHYYKTRTLSIWVGDKKVTSDARLERNQFKGTVWDTGSPHMWMPKWAYALTRAAFLGVLSGYRSYTTGNQKICFIVDRAEALKTFPLFRFELPDNIWLELTPMQYLVSLKINGQVAQCVDLIDAGNDKEGVAFGSTNMLNMLISYDYSHKRFGFMRHNCDCFLLPKADCVNGELTEGGLNSPALWRPTRQPTAISEEIAETVPDSTSEHSDKIVTLPGQISGNVMEITALPSKEMNDLQSKDVTAIPTKEITALPTSHPTLPTSHPTSMAHNTANPSMSPTPVLVTPTPTQVQALSFVAGLMQGYKLLKVLFSFLCGLSTGAVILLVIKKYRSKPHYMVLQTSDLIPELTQLTSEVSINDFDQFYDEDDPHQPIL